MAFPHTCLDKKSVGFVVGGDSTLKRAIMKDDLNELLKSWQPEAPKSAAFNRRVWGRIERCRGADGLFDSFFEWSTRPQIASVAAALSVLGGAWIGFAAAAQNGSSGIPAFRRSLCPDFL
jgi:hypothetical protein